MSPKRQLIDVEAAKGYVETFMADPILKMAANAVLNNTPRVDAVEVVHGRWLKLSPWNNHTQSCLCLNCDSVSYQKKGGVYIGKIPNYCPNCGAKMDGDWNA